MIMYVTIHFRIESFNILLRLARIMNVHLGERVFQLEKRRISGEIFGTKSCIRNPRNFHTQNGSNFVGLLSARSGTKCNWFGALIINWRLHFKCGMPRTGKGGCVCSPSETPRNASQPANQPARPNGASTLNSPLRSWRRLPLMKCHMLPVATVASPYDGRPLPPPFSPPATITAS